MLDRVIITIFVLLCLCSCYDNFSENNGGHNFVAPTHSIAQIKEFASSKVRPVEVEAVINGRVISSDSEQNIRQEIYIDDGIGALAIQSGIYYDLATLYPIGVNVSLKLNGCTICLDNELLKVGYNSPSSISNTPIQFSSIALLEQHLGRSEDIINISPLYVEYSNLEPSLCGRLLSISGLHYAPKEGEEIAESLCGKLRFTDKDSNELYIEIDSHATFENENIPSTIVTICGILNIEYDRSHNIRYILRPRYYTDISRE